jgi:two-component system copper resistance phosphate regulon response regulator CusR
MLLRDAATGCHERLSITQFMTLLLIEDEPKTLAYLSQGLRENGFTVETARSGNQGLAAIRSNQYELIVLDVMLPGLDGYSLLRELRSTGDTTPVLFLTARDSVQDRVNGLELGADDYLIKPFAFSELLARIRSVLRRTPPRQVARLCIADLEIDVARATALRAGRRLDLTTKQFSMLCLFVRHAGEVLSRKFLAEQVWDIRFETETNIVDVAIRRLRTKLDAPFPIKLIQSVRGVGYVLRPRADRGEASRREEES